MKRANLDGLKFNCWTAVRPAQKRSGKTAWLCRCDCGNERDVLTQSLLQSTSTSCGCEGSKRQAASNRTHGLHGSSEYGIHRNMVDRCHNPKNAGFKWYGAKGVSVCDEWRSSFAKFYADMGPRPSRDHSIDRIDNAGNYEKSNCRWATSKEQASNKTYNRMVAVKGETMTLAQAIDRFGGNYARVNARLSRGYSIEEAFAADGVVFHDSERSAA